MLLVGLQSVILEVPGYAHFLFMFFIAHCGFLTQTCEFITCIDTCKQMPSIFITSNDANNAAQLRFIIVISCAFTTL